MPTTLKRTNVTHVPRVERILNVGRRRWPGRSDLEILVGLAEERASEVETGRFVPAEAERVTTLGDLKAGLAEIEIDDEWAADIAAGVEFAEEEDPWGDD